MKPCFVTHVDPQVAARFHMIPAKAVDLRTVHSLRALTSRNAPVWHGM